MKPALLLAFLSCGLLVLPACDHKPQSAPTPPAPKPLDTTHAKKLSTRVPENQTYKALLQSNTLPYTLQLGKHGDLRIDDEAHSNIIADGEATLTPDSICKACEKPLRIQTFATTPDTVLIHVNVGQGSDTTTLGADNPDNTPPVLLDTNKARYLPIGYYYEDETKLKIRFTPGDVIQDATQLPSLSRSRPAQKLTLLYRVSAGRSIQYLSLSNTALYEFDPPVKQGVR
jgi:hypothetical protein